MTFDNQGAEHANRVPVRRHEHRCRSTTDLTVRGASATRWARGLQSWQIIHPRGASSTSTSTGGTSCATAHGPRHAAVLPATGATLARGRPADRDERRDLHRRQPREHLHRDLHHRRPGRSRSPRHGREQRSRSAGPTLAQQHPRRARRAVRPATRASDTTAVTTRQPLHACCTGPPPATRRRDRARPSVHRGDQHGQRRPSTSCAAGRVWNGEVIRVQTRRDGLRHDLPDGGGEDEPAVGRHCSSSRPAAARDIAGPTATFTFAGGDSREQQRLLPAASARSRSLIPCDLQSPPAPTQFTTSAPTSTASCPSTRTGDPADLTTNGAAYGSANYGVPDGIPDYVEDQDGSWARQSIDMAPSARRTATRRSRNSLIDIKGLADDVQRNASTNTAPPAGKLDSVGSRRHRRARASKRGFSKLWNTGQAGATAMAGPAPWQLDAIQNHKDPKEKTIVLFVTDGDDTCGTADGGSGGAARPTPARRCGARLLRARSSTRRIDATEPASSVQTYVIGYGGAFTAGDPYRLNWIAWGGSGLGQGTDRPARTSELTTTDRRDATPERAKRGPVHDLPGRVHRPRRGHPRDQLQAIIDQGASDGDFNAQQSITESVFEYVDRAASAADLRRRQALDALPGHRPDPLRLELLAARLQGAAAGLPERRAPGTRCSMWSAGDKLRRRSRPAMSTCNNDARPAAARRRVRVLRAPRRNDGRHDRRARRAKIKRRIYTTSRNGVYTFTPRPHGRHRPRAGRRCGRRRRGGGATDHDYATSTAPVRPRSSASRSTPPTCTLAARPTPSCVRPELVAPPEAVQGLPRRQPARRLPPSADRRSPRCRRRGGRPATSSWPSWPGRRPIPDTTRHQAHDRAFRREPRQVAPLQGPVLGPRRLGAGDGGGRHPAQPQRAEGDTVRRRSTSSSATARATRDGKNPGHRRAPDPAGLRPAPAPTTTRPSARTPTTPAPT